MNIVTSGETAEASVACIQYAFRRASLPDCFDTDIVPSLALRPFMVILAGLPAAGSAERVMCASVCGNS